ncbi:hypothetical protein Cni_G15364 [Canna indica]|uniref:Uncharacterized protein n=1 Tax=Canna indica TaxID=4628 RepID=A0AAQ3QFN3_9LILI|nr:hypothetical protein Cni_G15364 [Canna indica]
MELMALEGTASEELVKASLFVLVQSLVYLILFTSSINIFSTSKATRSHSFGDISRPLSFQRKLAFFFDFPLRGDGRTSPRPYQLAE